LPRRRRSALVFCLLTVSAARTSSAQGGGYCETTFKRELAMDPTSGPRGCEKTPGCCYSAMSAECHPCQALRGTWSGLLGICVFEPTSTTRSQAASATLGPTTTGECVPVVGADGKQVVDPAMLVFNNNTGRMITTDEPGTSSGGGGSIRPVDNAMPGPDSFNFDFAFTDNMAQGHVDLSVDTFMGKRLLLGKYEIEIPEVPCFPGEVSGSSSSRDCRLGTRLRLAIGSVR